MKNRILTLRLAVFLILLFAAVPHVLADYFVEQGIAYYTTSGNTVAVTSNWSGSQYSGSITIPTSVTHRVYSNYEEITLTFTVTSIDDYAFSSCSGLESVSIPNTVTEIGNRSFINCTSLKSIVIPNGVQKIGQYAFQNCSGLTSVTMANSVTSIGDNLFYGCTSLNNVKLSSSIRKLTNTFFGCKNLTSIEVPSSVAEIDGAFTGCSALSSVVLPSSLETIGTRSFEDCAALSSIFIPNSVTTIGQMAFNNSGLTSIEIPYSTTAIGRDAFNNCNQLLSVTSRPVAPPVMGNSGCFSNNTYDQASFYVPNFVKNTYQTTNWWSSFKNLIGKTELDNAYDKVINGIYYNITSDNTVSVTFKDNGYNTYSGNVTIPSTVKIDGKTYQVTGIGYCAFRDCSALNSVTIPNSVVSIDGQAFINSGLTSLTLPNSVQYIGSSAFRNCNGITSLTIPESVVSIGVNAFADCYGILSLTWNAKSCMLNGDLCAENITQVTIGESVEVLPEYFVSNSQITQVSLPESLVTIGKSAFMYCYGLTSLTIPANVKSIGMYAFSGCENVASLTWNAVNCGSTGDLPTYSITTATIGNGVVVLPSNFLSYSSISSITIPNSVTQISEYAFNGCGGLKALIIPESVASIGADAFEDCYGLQILTWNAIDCDYTGNMTCDNVTQVTIGNKVKTIPRRFCMNSGITSIDIPASVDTICDRAFQNCSQLPNLVIPNTVKFIGSEAFTCCSSISDITVQSGNSNYDSRNDCNAIIETLTNKLLVGCKSTVMPADITAIGEYAFSGSGLTTIQIPNSVTYIGENAFSYNPGLTNIDLPDGITSIKDYTFYNCSSLLSVKIGADVTSIEYSAFSNCKILQSFTCLSTTPPYVDYSAFYGVPQSMTVYVPAIALESYKNNYDWRQFNIQPISDPSLKGDVNGDGEVNIADVNALIDIIAGGAADADTRYRADVNGDGEVNIADINAVIDIILNPANNVGLKVNCGDLLHVDDVTMRPGDVRTLKVTLDRAAHYSAVQCDLVLPTGLTLVDAHAVGANVMRMGSMDDFTNRVLSYSMNKLPFVGDSQPVMTFTVRADAALAPESEITLTHVVLADAANKAWRTGDCTARVNNATGITDVTATASRVWVEKHTLCIESSEDGTARIATVSGMVRDLDVKAGITRHELDPGIYVVILDGQSYKISVK